MPGGNEPIVRKSGVVKAIVADLIEAIDDNHAVMFGDVGPYRWSIMRKPVSGMIVMDDNVGNGFDRVIRGAFATIGSHAFRVMINVAIRVTVRATSKLRAILTAQVVVIVLIVLVIIRGAVFVWRLDLGHANLPGICCFSCAIARVVRGDLADEPPDKRCICLLLPSSLGFPGRSALCEGDLRVSPRESFLLRLSN